MKNFFEKTMTLPMWYSIASIIVFALLSGELARELALPILQSQTGMINETTITITSISALVGGIFGAFLSWAVLSVAYHILALLMGGKEKIKMIFKLTGLAFLEQVPFVIAQLFIMKDLSIADGLDINTNPTMALVNTIGTIGTIPFYAAIICAVRYIYDIKWWKAAVVVAIPVAVQYGISYYTTTSMVAANA